mgnify:CR=1 FL=1
MRKTQVQPSHHRVNIAAQTWVFKFWRSRPCWLNSIYPITLYTTPARTTEEIIAQASVGISEIRRNITGSLYWRNKTIIWNLPAGSPPPWGAPALRWMVPPVYTLTFPHIWTEPVSSRSYCGGKNNWGSTEERRWEWQGQGVTSPVTWAGYTRCWGAGSCSLLCL